MTHASYFNPDILITRDNWAITMICNSESSGRPAISSGGSHAMLVLEKVKKTGEFFRQIIHLVGPGAHKEPKNGVAFLGCSFYAIHNRVGDVLLSKNNITDVSYTHKSETWLRSADKVRNMRREAKFERDNPTIHPRPFCIFGDRSVLAKDLETFKITDPFIAAFAYCDKQLFLKLFDRVQKCRDGLAPGIERLHQRNFNPIEDHDRYACGDHGDGGYNIAKVTTFAVWDSGRVVDGFAKWFGSERSLCWRNHISKDRYAEIADLFANTETSKDREELIKNAPEHEKEFFSQVKARFEQQLKNYDAYALSYLKSLGPKIVGKYPALKERVQDFMNVCEKDALLACRQIMWLIHEHASLCRITPDSCFTWAREKLLLIDVELTDVGTEHLLSPTKMYLKKAGDTEHFVYKNNSDQKFILSFKFKGAAIALEAKFVGSVKDSARTVVDPILKDFSFELLSEYDPRFKLFVHINNKEFDQTGQIFQKHLVFFQDCFQLGTLVQLIIAQNNPDYIKYFDENGLSFKYNGGDALWFAYQEGATEAFEALLKTIHMDLRTKDPKDRTFLRALLEDSYVGGRTRYNQLIKTFCQEFKQRYPESYKDFLNQKISIDKPLDALDIAVNTDNPESSEFFIEEGANYEDKLHDWAHRAQDFKRKVRSGPDGRNVNWEKTESYWFVMKIFSGSIGKELPSNIKALMLHYWCSNMLYGEHIQGVSLATKSAQKLIQQQMTHCSKHDIKYIQYKNNGPILMVLASWHITWKNKLTLIQLLLKGDHPDDVNQINSEGETPLTLAASHNFDILNFLLQRIELKVNQQDKAGNTALHCAILAGEKNRIEALIADKKINPNIQNNLGQTPLHLTWNRNIIQSLLAAGADASIKDNEGRTPRDVHEQNDPRLKFWKLLGY